MMTRRTQPETFVFIECSRHNARRRTEEFDPIGTLLCIFFNPFPRSVGAGDLSIATLSKYSVSKYPRRGDSVFRRFPFMFKHPIKSVATRWFPYSRNAVRHPEFENILCDGSLRPSDMS